MRADKQRAFYIGQNDCRNISPNIIQAITKCQRFRRPSELNALATLDRINEHYLWVLSARFSSRGLFDLILFCIPFVRPRQGISCYYYIFDPIFLCFAQISHESTNEALTFCQSTGIHMRGARRLNVCTDDTERFIAKETLLTIRRSSFHLLL